MLISRKVLSRHKINSTTNAIKRTQSGVTSTRLFSLPLYDAIGINLLYQRQFYETSRY